MDVTWIRSIVHELVNEFETTDPYELAANLNIAVVPWDLHEEINGYYKYDRRNKYIVYNSNLSDELQRVVCAHELGHALLHPRANTPFMKKNTLFSIDKIEREANRFAAELLIPDETFYECNSIYDIVSLHNVPVELAQLKYQCKEIFLQL